MGAARLLLAWLAAAMVAFAALPASAQTTTWTGGSNVTWYTPGNWSNGLPSTSVTAVFSGTTSTQPTDTIGSGTFGLIQFNSGAGSYTLGNGINSGNFLFTDGGGITVSAGVTTNQKIWTWIRTAATSGTSTVAITNNGTGLLDLNTFNSPFASGTNTLSVLSVGGSGTTQFAQVFERTSTNVTSVVKNGSGTLIILASATGASGSTTSGYFSGSTTINGGTLQLGDSTALGSGTGSIVFGGGTLIYSGSNTVDYSSRIRSGTSAISINTAGQSVTFSSALAASNTGGLTKLGSGALTLSAANAYTGTTSITAGVLNIQNASALGGTAAGTIVSNSAALQIQGSITVTGESLSLIGSGISNDGALRNISGTNTWTGAIAADGVGTVAANGDLSFFNRVASDAGLLTLSGPIQIAAPAASGSGALMLVQGNGNVVISGNISGGKAGNSSFVSSGIGTGTRTLSGSNSYLGWTIVNGNTIVEGGLAIPDASRVVMTSTNGRLVLNASETIGGLASSVASQINLNSHTLTIGADNTTPLAADVGGATYLGTIIGTGGIVKVGTGVLTLSAASSYSGGTVINAGTLALGSAGTFASSPTITVGNAGSSGAVLDLTSKTGTFAFTSGQTVGGIGTINIGSGKTVSSAGIWAPGNSIGSNAVTGNLTLSGTSQFELGTPGPSTSAPGLSDFTAVSGTLTLGGALNLINNAGANGNGSAAGGVYRLFTYGNAVSGSYASVTAPTAATRTSLANITYGGSGTAAGQGVFLSIYNLAAGNVTSGTSINLGTVLKNTSLSQALAISNTAPIGNFSEGLNATFGTLTGGATTNAASISLLTAGGTSTAMTVGLGSATAGAKNGTVQVNFASDGAGTSGLAPLALDPQTVSLTATVLDPATASFGSGPTALTTFTLNFGSVNQGDTVSAQNFSLFNLLQTAGYTADLALVDIISGTNNTSAITTDLATFNSLASGTFNSWQGFVNTTNQGTFSNTWTLQFKSANGGTAYAGDTTQTLTLSANVIVVPEPGAIALAGIGIAAAAWALRSRSPSRKRVG